MKSKAADRLKRLAEKFAEAYSRFAIYSQTEHGAILFKELHAARKALHDAIDLTVSTKGFVERDDL